MVRMGVFDRYAPFVQDFIYEHEWESLRGIQVAAGEALFNTDDHVLLCSSTASGKTEAAFFPILTEFWEDPPRSVGALYIGPTKALINDQFYRLTDLCAEAGVNVWHWHGDVSSSHKARLMRRPSGILQITPESLEALLMRRHAAVAKLFCDLRYVVIDEIHSLLRQDRGGQCLCLVERLSRIAGVEPRRVGLSATIGDPEAVGAFLAAGTGRPTIIPRVEEPPRTWRISMEHFFIDGPQADEGAPLSTDGAVEADVLAVEPVEGTGLPPCSSNSLRTDRPQACPAHAELRAEQHALLASTCNDRPGTLSRAQFCSRASCARRSCLSTGQCAGPLLTERKET